MYWKSESWFLNKWNALLLFYFFLNVCLPLFARSFWQIWSIVEQGGRLSPVEQEHKGNSVLLHGNPVVACYSSTYWCVASALWFLDTLFFKQHFSVFWIKYFLFCFPLFRVAKSNDNMPGVNDGFSLLMLSFILSLALLHYSVSYAFRLVWNWCTLKYFMLFGRLLQLKWFKT